MRRLNFNFHAIDGFDNVWSEEGELGHVSEEERTAILELQTEFPRLCDVDFEINPLSKLRLEGVAKVLGYGLRPASHVFEKTQVFLYAMAREGFIRLAREDVRKVVKTY